jgi:hypothetical protein
MASVKYSDLIQYANNADFSKKAVDARTWLRDTAQTVTRADPLSVMRSSKEMFTSRLFIGMMYLFAYDPKTKKTLPYYDTFPLIFPFEKTEDGFLGINMHYLPYALRAKLMDALYTLLSDKNYDDNTRLRLSYRLLKGLSQHRLVKPCIKHYLNSHVKSRFLHIPANQWEVALFLPLERFEKANRQTVFNNTIRKTQRP